MKKFIFSSMLLGGLMMASCSDDVMEAPVQEDVRKEFAKNFIERFGPISRTQDWTAAKLMKISINQENVVNAKVEVFAKVYGAYRLAGVYENVNTGDELTFTTYKGVEDFMLNIDGVAIQHDEAYNVAESRAFVAVDADKTFTKTTEPLEWGLTNFNNNLHRPTNGGGNNINQGYFSSDLMFVHDANNPSTYYPIFWDGREEYKEHILYLCYNNQDGPQRIPVYNTLNAGTDSQFSGDNGKTYTSFENPKSYEEKSQNGKKMVKVHGFTPNLPHGALYTFELEVPALGKTWSTSTTAADNDGKVQVGYQRVNTPLNGKEVGMLNFEEEAYEAQKNSSNSNKTESCADFNDFDMLVVNPNVVSMQPQKWLIAVEDLGTTDDYDFNDIVIEVTQISKNKGKSDVNITMLAAGGTLEAKLMRDGSQVGPEVHQWFEGVAEGTYPMINTAADMTSLKRGSTVKFNNVENFTMAAFTEVTPAEMGGFYVIVNGHKENTVPVKIESPERGDVPQIICVPELWMWPTERTEMDLAYNKFSQYVQKGGTDELFDGCGYPTGSWVSYIDWTKVVPRFVMPISE